ncbi:MAG: ROK family transcriptional regulator [Pseudomonadota bacterium]
MIQGDSLIKDPEGGSNQSGLRDQNARVVLSLIRRHGALSSAEIARRSSLSAQTVSNIIRALEGERLLNRGETIRGKVGKPSVPMALNPNGALALGLNIGRRAAELVLVDFTGRQLDRRTVSYRYPIIPDVLAFLKTGIESIAVANPGAKELVVGIGVGLPNELWNWLEIVDAPEGAMRAWRDLDIAELVAAEAGVEATLENDVTSACVAEHLLGRGSEFSDFAYFFIGAFVGGGLVLNSKVVTGAYGNAAAFGSLLVPKPGGGMTQLLNVASLHVLERAVIAAGIDPNALRDTHSSWQDFQSLVDPWIEETSRYLAIAAASVTSVVEIETVLIDGALPTEVREDLSAATQESLRKLDLKGIEKPAIGAATVGPTARSVGAALLPIHSRYFLA